VPLKTIPLDTKDWLRQLQAMIGHDIFKPFKNQNFQKNLLSFFQPLRPAARPLSVSRTKQFAQNAES
jgi:hypothetical protein